MKIWTLLALASLSSLVTAGPTPVVEQRELDLAGNLAAIARGIRAAVSQGDPTGVIDALRKLSPVGARPKNPAEAAAALQSITNGTVASPVTLYEYIANLKALSLIDSIDSLLDFANGVTNGQDSVDNVNRIPPDVIYPRKSACDASYSVDENTLRSAIYIPSTFTYGSIPPVILFPGTGNYGYETLSGNIITLLTGSGFADPVWVNVPGRLLDDAQKNAEFAAYAINYISSITNGKNVTVLAWSQGNINTQWAFKYWPSTARVTTNHIAVSPDYAGTVIANFVSLPGEPLPPSVLQQQYLQSSNFITTLRTCDGDSAYVPTTTIYSGFFDEIVEPQQGTGASAFLKDARGVGVTNNQVQLVCPGQPAGSFYTHEGVLYNPLTYFLLKDAMANGGPGDVRRLDLPSVCATYLTPGLDLGNLLVTENAIAIAGLAILTYPSPVFAEPAISAYATSCPTSVCPTTTTTSTVTSTSSSVTSSTLTSLTTTATVSTSSTAISSTSSTRSTSVTSSTSVTYSSITTTTSSLTTPSTTSESQATTSLTSTSVSITSTTSSTNTVWNAWSPITTLPPSRSASDNEGSWTDWQPITSPTVQVTTRTWTSGTATYTSCITVTVSSTSASASASDWSSWTHTPTTTTIAAWTNWNAHSTPTDRANTATWSTWTGTTTDNHIVETPVSTPGSDIWSDLPTPPTSTPGPTTSPSLSATASGQWQQWSTSYPTTSTSGSSDNWNTWSDDHSATGLKGSARPSGTAVVAQWKGTATTRALGRGIALLALAMSIVVLVIV